MQQKDILTNCLCLTYICRYMFFLDRPNLFKSMSKLCIIKMVSWFFIVFNVFGLDKYVTKSLWKHT